MFKAFSILLLCVVFAYTVGIDQNHCESIEDCDAGFRMICKNNTCMCKTGELFFEWPKFGCFVKARLLEKCEVSGQCMATNPNTYCNPENGRCTCSPNYYFNGQNCSLRRSPECPEGRTGLFPVLDDCTSYLKCFRGKGRVVACPGGFRFDSAKHCTPDDDADCGYPTPEQKETDSYCQEYFGIFPYPPDCHKYVFCDQGRGQVRSCPDNQVYSDISGCTVSDKCL